MVLAHGVSVAKRARDKGRFGLFILCDEKHHLFANGTPMSLRPNRS